jgi:hypothetical protein
MRFPCIALVALGLVGGAGSQGPTVPTAIMSPDAAEFWFPRDTQQWFDRALPDSIAYAGHPLYSWEVAWPLPSERMGADPEALWVVVRWEPGRSDPASLGTLLAERPIEVMTWCTSCGSPGVLGARDRAVTYEVQEGTVIFRVRGREAIARIFPRRPDTVVFTRRRQGVETAEWKVAVR